jgi:hypothetical protein
MTVACVKATALLSDVAVGASDAGMDAHDALRRKRAGIRNLRNWYIGGLNGELIRLMAALVSARRPRGRDESRPTFLHNL